MNATLRARPGLSATLTIALALSVLVPVGPPARAQSCPPAIFAGGIASTGSSVVLVASANGSEGGDLYYFWQRTGTSTWHRELVAAGGCAGPGFQPDADLGYWSSAIAWTGGSVVIAAVDQRNGGLHYWWQGKGTTPWHQETVATGPPGCCSKGSVVNGSRGTGSR